MDIAGKGSQPYVDSLVNEIKRLDLSENVMELEAYGFTVIPPSKSGITEEWLARLQKAILTTVERRHELDLADWETRTTDVPMLARTWELIPEDDVFAEAALQPAGLAMARWLCGQTVAMVGHTLIAKGPSPADRPWTQMLHNDMHGVPGGGDICHGCNVSILATDYASTDDGPTILAPGSHHFARAPMPDDMKRQCLPLEGEAGSIAVWNDFTCTALCRERTPVCGSRWCSSICAHICGRCRIRRTTEKSTSKSKRLVWLSTSSTWMSSATS